MQKTGSLRSSAPVVPHVFETAHQPHAGKRRPHHLNALEESFDNTAYFCRQTSKPSSTPPRRCDPSKPRLRGLDQSVSCAAIRRLSRAIWHDNLGHAPQLGVEHDEAGGPASIPAPGRDSRVSQALLVAGALDRAKHFRMNENGPGSALDPTPDGRYASASVRRRKIVALLGTRTAIVMRRRSDRSSLRKRRVSP